MTRRSLPARENSLSAWVVPRAILVTPREDPVAEAENPLGGVVLYGPRGQAGGVHNWPPTEGGPVAVQESPKAVGVGWRRWQDDPSALAGLMAFQHLLGNAGHYRAIQTAYRRLLRSRKNLGSLGEQQTKQQVEHSSLVWLVENVIRKGGYR